ncbi:MAG: potassium-transporting ATPase subunit F [Armatimonadetes bacterium]|nr:potassium-transporting ATPase subunit F [Armatimonadota bacterium]MBS1711064.1 potassium-transporting ATPase subunit F [Armatimonadota bacterium]MBX3108736.1 potassium-transporting ATPase subunit F [Fimbriimonadaceae bacterium]
MRPTGRGEGVTEVDILGIVGALILGYLGFALLKPEKF